MSDAGRAATEAVLTEALDDVPATLREPCRRLAHAGGERLRAGLVLAVAGRAWPGTSRRTATAAAAVELLHLATLVHADLRDDVPVRGGVPTANAKEGPAVALLAGDVLLGLAHRLAAIAGTAGLLGDALVDLCAGQALEAEHRFDADLSEAGALRVAELRSGTLFAAAARAGAIVTGAPQDGLDAYGRAFGTAVQLLDDVLEPAADFAKGVVTVPAVHSLAAHPPLRAMMRRELDDSHHKLLCSGVPATLATVDSLIDEAAAVRPDLAEPARRYRDSRLALVLPRYRSLLSS